MLLLRLLRTQMTMMAMMMTARAATTGTTRLRLVRKYMILCSSSSGPVSALPSPPSSLAGARVPGEVLLRRQLLTFLILQKKEIILPWRRGEGPVGCFGPI